MKIINYLILVVFAGLLIFATLSLPPRGIANTDADQEFDQAGVEKAPAHYIKSAYHDAHTPNMVSVILADYRSYDTLGEETVILTAALVCFLLLRDKKRKNEDL